MMTLSDGQIESLPNRIPIEGYEHYEIDVRRGIVYNPKGKALKNSLSQGYRTVKLYGANGAKTHYIHRLVAAAAFGFFGITCKGMHACHLDEYTANNTIYNIGLGTAAENRNMPLCATRIVQSLLNHPKLSCNVGQYLDGNLVRVWASTREAERHGYRHSGISMAANGSRPHYKGYTWEYV